MVGEGTLGKQAGEPLQKSIGSGSSSGAIKHSSTSTSSSSGAVNF